MINTKRKHAAWSTLYLRGAVLPSLTIFRENMAFDFDVLKPIRAGIAGLQATTKLKLTGGGQLV